MSKQAPQASPQEKAPKKSSVLKKVFFGIGIFVLLIFGCLATVILKPNVLRGAIHAGGERFAGLDIEIGALKSRAAPMRLEITGLRISNPNWPEPTLLTLDSLSLKLLASPLGKSPFWAVESDGLNIRIENNDKGELNWLTATLQASAESSEEEPEEDKPSTLKLPGDFSFEHILLRNTQFQLITAEGENYQLALPEISGEREHAGSGDLVIELDYRQQHITVSSTVDLFDPAAGILDYRLALQHADATLNSEGRLALNPTLEGSRISVALAIETLDQLTTLADFTAPALPPSKLETTLNIGSAYQLTPLTIAIGENQIDGDIQLSPDFNNIVASLNSKNLDIDALLADLTPAAEAPEQAVEPAPSEEKSTAEAEMDWGWMANRDITLKLDIADLSASGWSLKSLNGELNSRDAITLKLQIAELLETATGRQLNELASAITLTPLADKTQGADAKLALALNQQDITLKANGKVNINGIAGTQLNIESTAPQSLELWKIALLPWQEAGAMNINANIETTAEQYQLKADATLGEQSTKLALNYQPGQGEQLAMLKGDIALSKTTVDFMSAPTEQTPADSTPKSETSNTKKGGKLISNEPLALDALKQLNADLTLSLNQVDTGYAFINSAKLKPKLRNGVFQLDDSRLNLDGAEAYIRAKLDASGEQAALSTELKIDGTDYGKLGLEKTAGISKGQGKIRVILDGKGASPAALAASLGGKLDIKITDMQAKGNALNLIGSDVLMETFDKLNPFAEKKENTEIECLAVHFKGDKGRFTTDDGIALETDGSKIIGTGFVDLGSEKLQLGVSPIARKGVGVNVGAAASLVRLGGTFSKPKVEADPGGMFTSGLSTGAAIYTGGLSLLAQGLVKRALYAGSACDGELDEIPSADEVPEEILHPTPPALEPEAQPESQAGNQPVN
ncbi:AsmA family protein [Spongiibacter sp. KMU-158]|uniref:AsmA family protein n=1 Tax=Spongiibacter pelagi TaxID=2760804 RepID=A0A927GWE0_9GAMM|nr:AsmA family protein [Spongiibacter pelagi]MBD2858842.1 AsmA family protein [Spongiibacter pelagi]